jgi:hypothetical protein
VPRYRSVLTKSLDTRQLANSFRRADQSSDDFIDAEVADVV